MKSLLPLLCFVLTVSACRTPIALNVDQNSAGTPNTDQTHQSKGNAADASKTQIEKVPFRLGTSSFTVEKLASQNQCESQTGAGLLARNGPTEVYRVDCKNGKVYMARCEMHQCSTMSPSGSGQ